jgi:hypothetical protein
VTAENALEFFDRLQVDWILESLFARYSERDAVTLLYGLLQRGTVLDPNRFDAPGFGLLPDGRARGAEELGRALPLVDLQGADGFVPRRAAYRDAVIAIDGSPTGRGGYPMRLVIAQSPDFASTHIPLSAQVSGGLAQVPRIVLNPSSPSLNGRFGGPLTDGSRVAVVGNVSYAAGQRFETVLARAEVRTDPVMAPETIWMLPGWNGLDRGGQRVVRGIHSEEGEAPALFDNLVRLEEENFTPAGNAADRASPPPKR